MKYKQKKFRNKTGLTIRVNPNASKRKEGKKSHHLLVIQCSDVQYKLTAIARKIGRANKTMIPKMKIVVLAHLPSK